MNNFHDHLKISSEIVEERLNEAAENRKNNREDPLNDCVYELLKTYLEMVRERENE